MPDVQLSDAERRVLEAIDEERLVADLVRLVRIPSITGTDVESELQHLRARDFMEAGLEVDLWHFDLDALRRDPEFPGLEAERSEGYGLVGIAPGQGVPGLVLQGHVDVVPVGDLEQWAERAPFSATIRGDILHGRGACDMKAGVAVNLAVARALRDSGVRTERRLAVHSVVGEEDGGVGAFATLRRGHTGASAIITEPTNGGIITATAGALTFQLDIAGRSAHGSTRLEGVSAIDAFWPVARALHELEARRNTDLDPLFDGNPLPYGISIGQLSAGTWASSVPDLLTASGRLGVRLGEDPAVARHAFEEAVAEAAAGDPWLREYPPRVTWPGGQFASGQLPKGHPLADEVTTAVTELGGVRPGLAGAPYGSDLRLYSGLGGIPTLHYGPGDVRLAHGPRERVSLSETLHTARVLALVAARRLGAH